MSIEYFEECQTLFDQGKLKVLKFESLLELEEFERYQNLLSKTLEEIDLSFYFGKDINELSKLFYQYLDENTYLKRFKLLLSCRIFFPVSLSHNNSLEYLSLSRCALYSEDLLILCNLLINSSTLKKLDLYYNGITDEDYSVLSPGIKQSPSLKSFKFSNSISEHCTEFYDSLAENTSIISLHLESLNIYPELFFKSLYKKNYKKLKLRDCIGFQIHDLFDNINSMEKLEVLKIENLNIDDESGSKLFKTLNNKKLKSFRFSKNGLGEISIKEIPKFMKKHQNLKVLMLDNNRFRKKDLVEILENLTDSLKILDLNHNYSKDEIEDINIYSRNLTSLNLSNCSLKPLEFQKLIRSLSKNSSITELFCSLNKIKINEETSNYFQENKSLKRINLDQCYLNDEDIKYLCLGLRGKILEKLSIRKNVITCKGCKYLELIIKENGSIQDIQLTYNEKIGEKGLQYLEEYFLKCEKISFLDSDKIDKTEVNKINQIIFSNYNLIECFFDHDDIDKFSNIIINRNKKLINNYYSIPTRLKDIRIYFV